MKGQDSWTVDNSRELLIIGILSDSLWELMDI